MSRYFALILGVLLITGAAHAAPAPDAPELTKLLTDFLAGATRNDAEAHQAFWADDLVYTGSNGTRKGKAEILKEVREEGPAKPDADLTVFTAEDVSVRQYGDTAVVAFRLVGSTEKKSGKEVQTYFNTGTFLKRDGKWQVVAWQATIIPKKEKADES